MSVVTDRSQWLIVLFVLNWESEHIRSEFRPSVINAQTGQGTQWYVYTLRANDAREGLNPMFSKNDGCIFGFLIALSSLWVLALVGLAIAGIRWLWLHV